MTEEKKTAQSELDFLKEQTRQYVKGTLELTFSDWGDETIQKFDPYISTLQLTLRDIYTNPKLDQKRVEIVLKTINGLLKKPDNYKERKLNSESIQDLRLFTIFIKASPWLLSQSTPEDFSSFIDFVGKRKLPQCLTSDAEISRLNVQFGNIVASENQHMFSSQPEPGHLQLIRTAGESPVINSGTATDTFLNTLKKENSLTKAIGQVTQQYNS